MLIAALAALVACGTALAQDKGAGFSDAVISGRVVSALEKDAVLKEKHIVVETRGGVVYLRGYVDSIGQSDRATALARRIDGVSDVRNALRVTNPPSRT
jgi:hyperosmotically inducible protein